MRAYEAVSTGICTLELSQPYSKQLVHLLLEIVSSLYGLQKHHLTSSDRFCKPEKRW